MTQTVDQIRQYIEAHLDAPVTLGRLSAESGLSPYQVHRAFQRELGVTPRQYADALRLERVRLQLRGGESIAAATFDAGYGSSSRLYERSASSFGMTPATYARGGQGARILFTIGECRLGRLLVAATGSGLCAVRLGASDSALERELRGEFPRAEIQRDDRPLRPYVDQVLARLDGVESGGDLPLDVQATAFQRRVWEALRTIPRGETRSYAGVAHAIGRPKAARAVARACAANPVAVVIPCHRVVRGDGDAGGYRWGKSRKKALLAAEMTIGQG